MRLTRQVDQKFIIFHIRTLVRITPIHILERLALQVMKMIEKIVTLIIIHQEDTIHILILERLLLLEPKIRESEEVQPRISCRHITLCVLS